VFIVAPAGLLIGEAGGVAAGSAGLLLWIDWLRDAELRARQRKYGEATARRIFMNWGLISSVQLSSMSYLLFTSCQYRYHAFVKYVAYEY
jgi:hypothetical protein